jgi:hypothetical protein
MKKAFFLLNSILIVGLGLGYRTCLNAQSNVLTFHNDLARTGANLNELALSPSSLSTGSFSKLFSHTVDGHVYAQPLYKASVPIAGQGRHNVVFVATEGDSVYAFDADNVSGTNAAPLWRATFANGQNIIPIPTNVGAGEDDNFGCVAVNPQVGITSTPVIDPSSRTLYAVAATKEISGGSVNYVHRLHAIDITTGLERPGSGVAVSGPASGAYNPQYMVQRTGLLLLSGKIYMGFASTCDHTPYNGFLATFDAATLQQTSAMLVPSPAYNGMGGIWGGGGAPAVDATGNIYVAVGNGEFDSTSSFGSSLLKLNQQLQITDYFSPADAVNINLPWIDLDLGSSMPMLLPDSDGLPGHPHLMVIGGKEGLLYLVDRDNLQKWEPAGYNFLPAPPLSTGSGGIFGRYAYFNGAVYVSTGYGPVAAYAIAGGLTPSPAGATAALYGPWTGASLSISANGTSGGIVWVLSADGDGYTSQSHAVLEAYDATNLKNRLFSSSASPADAIGIGVRFSVPTVASGKVYAGAAADSLNGTIATFGLTNQPCAADVSSQVSVARGGWRYNHQTDSYGETLTLTNNGNTTVGPLAVVFDNLSSYSDVTSASGSTTCGAGAGSYYEVPAGSATLAPGQSVPVYVTATSVDSQSIQFTTRVLAGGGTR